MKLTRCLFCFLETDAANDAHSSLMVYNRLLTLARRNGVVLDETAYSSSVNAASFFKSVSPITQDSSIPDATSTVSRTSSLPSTTTSSIPASSYAGLSRTQSTSALPTEGPPPNTVKEPMRPQQLRAYRYWHEQGMSLQKMSIALSLKGDALKPQTVM